MKIRKILLSTVMGAAVFMAAGQASAAQTQQTLQPNGNWAVTRIPGKSGDAYCAMARRYSGDVILTFARNSADEMSLAIDFQKEKLTKGQGYDVMLNPGSGQERSYSVEPVSGKAVVLRLGRDPAFHDALAKSGTLGLDIAGEQYAFNAPDIDTGMKEVAGCLASLAEPAAGDEKPQAQVPPAETPVVAAADNAAMPPAHEADLLREENDRLKRALERERREFENKFQSGDSSNITAELNEKIHLLEMDNQALKQQLAGTPVAAAPVPVPAPAAVCPATDDAEASKATAAMAKELTGLRDENAKLRQQAAAAPVSEPAADPALEKELSALRTENGTLRGQVESLNIKLAQMDSQMAQDKAAADNSQQKMDAQSVATIGRLQGRVEVLEAENASLKESLRAAQSQAQMASAAAANQPKETGAITISQLRSVEEQLKSVESERDSLRAQIEAVHRGKEDAAIGNIGGGDWSLEQATRRFNEAEREIRRLGAQIEQERTQCSADKKEIEYKLFDPAIATQEQIAKLSALEQEVAEAKASSATDVTGYEQQIAELKQAVAAKDSEIASLRDTIGSTQRMAAASPASAPVSYAAEPLRPQIAAANADYSGDARRQEMNEKAHIVSKPVPETTVAVENIAPAAGAPVTDIPAAASAHVSGEGDIVSILAAAGIDNGGIKKVRDAATAGYDAYSWESGGLFGSAEIRTISSGDDFDTLVNRYVERTKGRCTGGDFAAIPAPDAGQGGADPVRAVELACVGGDASASASVVFFRRGNSFVTIAHEAPVEGMDTAMDARDRIATSLTQGKLASR